MDRLVVLITAPREKSDELARRLVEEGLAACVNVIRGVHSVYRWEGRVEEDEEDLLIVKTVDEAYRRLEARVRELHPYQVPEVIALRIERGLPEYLSWIDGSVSVRGVLSSRRPQT